MTCPICHTHDPREPEYDGAELCRECTAMGWQDGGHGEYWRAHADGVEAMPMLRLRCGWCRAILREGVEPETTGICPSCAETWEQEVACPL